MRNAVKLPNLKKFLLLKNGLKKTYRSLDNKVAFYEFNSIN